MNKKPLKKILISAIILIGVLFVFNFTLAQDDLKKGLEEMKEEAPSLMERVEPGPLIVTVVTWIMSFIGAIAIAFIVYGAITYVTSAGNEKRVAQAKNIILYAIVGFIIAILAVFIIQMVGRVAERAEYPCSLDPSEGGMGSEWFCMTLTDTNNNNIGDENDVPAGYECKFSEACRKNGQPAWCCGGKDSLLRCCK